MIDFLLGICMFASITFVDIFIFKIVFKIWWWKDEDDILYYDIVMPYLQQCALLQYSDGGWERLLWLDFFGARLFYFWGRETIDMPTPKYDEKRDQWCIRARVIVDGREIFKRFSADTKKACNQAYIDYMAEYTPNYQSRDTERICVSQLASEYLASNKQRWKESTYYDVANRVHHITDTLGEIDARKLSAADVQGWQNGLDNYSFKYKKTLRTLLSSILKYGERIHDIPSVMVKVDTLRDLENHEIEYWTPEEFQQFMLCVEHTYALFFRFLYISGCRKGEAMAIKKADIHGNSVHICKSITSKGSDIGWTVTTPKNRQSVRDVDMPAEIIKEMLETQGEWVFGGDRPYPLRTLDRVWEQGIADAGVKRIKIHDLRHSCASLLISRGASIVAVSQRLGHKDTKMTLNTYSHLMPMEKDKVIQAFTGI